MSKLYNVKKEVYDISVGDIINIYGEEKTVNRITTKFDGKSGRYTIEIRFENDPKVYVYTGTGTEYLNVQSTINSIEIEFEGHLRIAPEDLILLDKDNKIITGVDYLSLTEQERNECVVKSLSDSIAKGDTQDVNVDIEIDNW